MANLPEDILDRIRQLERRIQRTSTAATTSAAVSPWQSLPLTAPYTKQTNQPRYRVQGPMVAVCGDVAMTGGGSLVENAVLAYLPAGARPATQQIIAVATPNTTASRVDVNPDGSIVYHGPNAAWGAFNFVVALG